MTPKLITFQFFKQKLFIFHFPLLNTMAYFHVDHSLLRRTSKFAYNFWNKSHIFNAKWKWFRYHMCRVIHFSVARWRTLTVWLSPKVESIVASWVPLFQTKVKSCESLALLKGAESVTEDSKKETQLSVSIMGTYYRSWMMRSRKKGDSWRKRRGCVISRSQYTSSLIGWQKFKILECSAQI